MILLAAIGSELHALLGPVSFYKTLGGTVADNVIDHDHCSYAACLRSSTPSSFSIVHLKG